MKNNHHNILQEKKNHNNPLPDYHMHTTLCHHATGTPAQYRKAAADSGIPEICFVDHAPNPDGYDPKHRMHLNDFGGYGEMIRAEMGHSMPRVLFGIEADYYEGCERFLAKWLERENFDYVLGSVHYIGHWGFDNPYTQQVWNEVSIPDTWAAYFKLIEKLADLRLFDAVAHLDLPKKFGHVLSERVLREMIQPVLDKIAEAGMGMELNTSGLRKPVKEIYPSPLIVSLAREREIPICFGSDAHSPDDVGKDFPAALRLARDAGYTQYFRIRKRQKTFFPLPEVF